MQSFKFVWGTKIIFGAGKLSLVGGEAAQISRKCMLVTGKRAMRKLGVLDKVLGYLEEAGVEVVLYDKVEPNPRVSTVDEGAGIAREENVGLVIGLGGGSAMDAAKGIALVARQGGSIWDYIGLKIDHTEPREALPIMEIPTVAATGAEANSTGVFTNWETHEKGFVRGDALYPKVAIIDPTLTFSVPPKQTAEGGVDIICHMLEPYITAESPFTPQDRIAEGVFRTVIENVPVAIREPENLEARGNLSWASTIACSPFRNIGWGGMSLLHWIEHTLSGWFDVSHGGGLAALLVSWMNYMKDVCAHRIAQFGKEVFGVGVGEDDMDAADAGIEAMKKWMKDVGVLYRLREFGVKEEDCRGMAEATIKFCAKGEDHLPGPKPLYAKDIENIYLDAM